MDPKCPICHNTRTKIETGDGDYWNISCPRCGLFSISGTLISIIPDKLVDLGGEAIAKVSFALRQIQEDGEKPFLRGNMVDNLVENTFLPDLNEQANRLILYVGRYFRPGVSHPIPLDDATGFIGALDTNGTMFIIDSLVGEGFLEKNTGAHQEGSVFASLTMKGFNKHKELKSPVRQGTETTPLYPQVSKRIDDFYEKLNRESITPWLFMLSHGVSLTGAKGNKVHYEGIKFEGTPRLVFWQFIPPFLTDFIPEMVEYVYKECKENQLEPYPALDEVAGLLKRMVSNVYNRMAEVERRLHGNGMPETVDIQDVSDRISNTSSYIDEFIEAKKSLYRAGNKASTLAQITLSSSENPTETLFHTELAEIISKGEGQNIEFKSTAKWCLRKQEINQDVENSFLKAIAGFLNSDGGIVLIGVEDSGSIIGLELDYQTFKTKQNSDGFLQYFRTKVFTETFSKSQIGLIKPNIKEMSGKEICQVIVKPSRIPVLAKINGQKQFFVRNGTSVDTLSEEEMLFYVQNHTWGSPRDEKSSLLETKVRSSFLIIDLNMPTYVSGGVLKTIWLEFFLQNTGDAAEIKRVELYITPESEPKLLKAPFYLDRSDKTDFKVSLSEKECEAITAYAETHGDCPVSLVLLGYFPDTETSLNKEISLASYLADGRLEQVFDKLKA